MIRFALALALVGSTAGCLVDNELSCELDDNAALPECTGIEPPACDPACPTNQVCMGNRCVECVVDADCHGNGVCGAANSCGCAAHADCTNSLTCDLEGGHCLADSDVVYVKAGETGQLCTLAAPCGSVSDGVGELTESRKYMRVEGNVVDTNSTTFDGQTAIIFGVNATISRTGSGEILHVVQSSNVTMFDATLTGATGATSGHGILIEDEAAVRLERVTIRNNTAVGVRALAGSLLTMRRCVLIGNSLGGLNLADIDINLTNNLFVRNGGTMSPIGGLKFDLNNKAAINGSFDFNTIASNGSQTASVRGVNCAFPVSGRGNIISDNDSNGSLCDFTDTLYDGAALTGDNVLGMPRFVQTTNLAQAGFFRLQPTSDAIDRAPPSATSEPFDIDGQPRLQGAMLDLGADEAK